nr:reverse transcriptase domain-containing protein [Tanacetum cinerariifolium]
LSDSDPPITTSWSGKSGCKATVKLAGWVLSFTGVTDDVVTDAHSVGINMVLRIVAIPPSTGNLSISWTVDEHRLNIREGYTPVRQKKRGQTRERARAIQAEVQKLVDARIMREVYYHDWQSNPVMVKKHDGSWRICVDFTDLNRACPQDCYPLPKIDWKRLMDKAFESQVGRNIEVYMDDLVVKSHTEAEMVRDIEETFQTLRKVNMKLNLKKCSFGLAEGVFLRQRGPEPQWKVGQPKSVSFQISRKISTAVLDLKKCIKKSDFRWTAEAEQAFQQLKRHLSDLPLLVAPNPQEELIMYLYATYGAVSSVPMTERGTTQMPIYFISRPLQGSELNYSLMEKLVMSLAFAAKWLRRPRTSVKGQILADFLTEMPGDVLQATPVAAGQEEPWTLFTDGSSCMNGSGARLILTNPEGVKPLFEGAGEGQVPDSRNGLLHEVGRSQGGGNDYRRVEGANRSLREGIKARLGEGNKNWVEELPHVLWAHQTMIKSSHGDTPFSLTYGTKAVIPAEIGMPTYRTATVDVVNNDKELRLNLDLLEERRERAAVCEARAKSKMMKYYNARVRGVAFKPGDFVYRSNDASHAVAGGKLGPK